MKLEAIFVAVKYVSPGDITGAVCQDSCRMSIDFIIIPERVVRPARLASTVGNVKGQDERFAPLTFPTVPAFWSIGDD